MRISQLAERSGVPVPTVKYYLREQLLMPGEATGATSAEYDEQHLRRLALVRALVEVGGLPLAKVRTVIEVIEGPGPSLFEALGRALAALPPYVGDEPGDCPRAERALAVLDQAYAPQSTGVMQLESALSALERAGHTVDDDHLRELGRQVHAIAESEIADMPHRGADEAIEYAVLGTILYEPLILALRRLAHQDLYLARAPAGDETDQRAGRA